MENATLKGRVAHLEKENDTLRANGTVPRAARLWRVTMIPTLIEGVIGGFLAHQSRTLTESLPHGYRELVSLCHRGGGDLPDRGTGLSPAVGQRLGNALPGRILEDF